MNAGTGQPERVAASLEELIRALQRESEAALIEASSVFGDLAGERRLDVPHRFPLQDLPQDEAPPAPVVRRRRR